MEEGVSGGGACTMYPTLTPREGETIMKFYLYGKLSIYVILSEGHVGSG